MKPLLIVGAAHAAAAFLGERHLGARFFHARPDDHSGGFGIGRARIFMDKDDPGGGGGGTMTEEQFRSSVLTGVKSMQTKFDELTKNYDQLTKETKAAHEDLTKVKNENGDFQQKLLALQKVHLQMTREARMAYGDPVQRLLANEEARTYINALARRGLNAPLTDACKKALGEDSSPGSTYLRDEIAKDIYDALPEYGIWNTLAVEPMSTKNTSMPVDTADPVALFVDEAGTIADDGNITGSAGTLTAKQIAVLINISMQLLEDSEYDVTSRIMKKFLRAVANRYDYVAFRADGTADATNGGYTGVFNFGTVITAGTGNTTVEALDFEDITSVVLGAPAAILTRMCRWWMHPYILIRMLSIKDSNGRPIFLTATEAPTPGGLGSILGYPVTLGNVLPTTNSAGAKVAAFGDPDAYVIGNRKDVQFDFSDHAKWNSVQRSFRAIARAGFKGRLNTALTILKTAAS